MLTLTLPPQVCAAKLFALRSTAGRVDLPQNATITTGHPVGDKTIDSQTPADQTAGAPTRKILTHRLEQTTTNDDAVNVMYASLPDGQCMATDQVEFEVTGRSGLGLAVSEVEIYATDTARGTTDAQAERHVLDLL